MIFGIPKEIRAQEMRVGAMPSLVKELVKKGNEVLVECNAGEYCDAPDSQYEQVGASIVPSAEKLYPRADLILKIREPKSVEYDLIRHDQIIFAYFHLFNRPDLVDALASRGGSYLAYDLIHDRSRNYPMVLPLSNITGQMAVTNGACLLQKQNGGRGILLGRVTGSPPAVVTILGAGNVGRQAVLTACALGARVVAVDTDYRRLSSLDSLNLSNLSTLIYNDDTLRSLVKETDLLISCIHLPEKPTPVLVTGEMVKTMKQGSVIVEVDIDLGGSIETGKVTTHENPTFIVDGVVHYCVSNITSAVPLIASRGISAAILPYLMEISDIGFEGVLKNDPGFANGVAIYKGHVVKEFLARETNLPLANLQTKIEELSSEE